MKLQKFRWSKVYESQEEELAHLLESRNITARIQDVDEFASLEVTPVNDVTLWCAEGSFKLDANGQSISMQPGDALPIQMGTVVKIQAGMSGCTFYETDSAN